MKLTETVGKERQFRQWKLARCQSASFGQTHQTVWTPLPHCPSLLSSFAKDRVQTSSKERALFRSLILWSSSCGTPFERVSRPSQHLLLVLPLPAESVTVSSPRPSSNTYCLLYSCFCISRRFFLLQLFASLLFLHSSISPTSSLRSSSLFCYFLLLLHPSFSAPSLCSSIFSPLQHCHITSHTYSTSHVLSPSFPFLLSIPFSLLLPVLDLPNLLHL